MNIIFIGPPGAGKGTQGELLAKKLNLPRFSAGAILRRVWKGNGPTSKKIGQYMLKGLNVPANVLFEAISTWFASHQEGFIADNLPRNLDQLEEFKKFIKKTEIKIDKVFHLVVSEEEAIRRIKKRHSRRLINGNARPDESPEVIKKRIETGYKKDIKPILTFFEKMGVLVDINGEKSVAEVHKQIMKHLHD